MESAPSQHLYDLFSVRPKTNRKGALSELNNFIEPSGSHKESTINVMVR